MTIEFTPRPSGPTRPANANSLLIDGKTIAEWNRQWRPVVGGLAHYQPHLRGQVGLYRISLNGRVVVLGKATERAGGLAKRLSDFRRPSPSGMNHHAGKLIHENLEMLEGEVLITGSDRNARELAQQLKTPMIRLHRPSWSAPNAPFMRKG